MSKAQLRKKSKKGVVPADYDTKTGEKVRTTNFTTSKFKKSVGKVGDNHYIKKIYKSDQNVEKGKVQNIEMWPLVDHYYDITTTTKKKDFRRCDFTYGVKKDQNVKNKNINYLWRITYGFQGLQGVRLGSVRLGQVMYGQAGLGQVRLG